MMVEIFSFVLPPLPSSTLSFNEAIETVDTSLVVWELSPWVFEAGEINTFCVGLSFTNPNDGNREIEIDLGIDGDEIAITIPTAGRNRRNVNNMMESCVFLDTSLVGQGGDRKWSTSGCRLDMNATAALGRRTMLYASAHT